MGPLLTGNDATAAVKIYWCRLTEDVVNLVDMEPYSSWFPVILGLASARLLRGCTGAHTACSEAALDTGDDLECEP